MLEQILYASATLVALMAPIGELSIFLTIMEGRSTQQVRRAALKVSVGAFVVLLVTLFAGVRILGLFGVSLPAFRAAGGLILIVIGLQMLQGLVSPVLSDPHQRVEPDEHLWVPLVMPLTAGPATMITVISLSVRETAGLSILPLGTLVALTIATMVVLLILLFAIPLQRVVRPRVARLFERFFGLILVSIGFQMGLTGIAEFFAGR
jgi:multiple antibiotic resistance protein